MTHYRERLVAPVLWWVLLAGLTGSAWLVYHQVYGPGVSLPVAAGVFLLGAAALLAYGRLLIAVDTDGVTVGRARLPLTALGPAEAMTGDAARTARGPGLDPRAYLAIRGYVPGVVRIGVDDDADPTPYWLVSTRRPERLVAVLEAARQTTGR
ncbi:DUF3093 domain-containing protein [Jiangella ureilytica]|uniref:DUF3093 domain-containing protein n=1 Tax=Jiangella ureilytica TaxID=2530374 RepID=A0A4R4RFP1_9ACTN|nr:DUF3093 domain-containing protein [Jiangella ureilytica]TDC48201.1 DUF3093 domain-containing protein [Jiangella ureilytica]